MSKNVAQLAKITLRANSYKFQITKIRNKSCRKNPKARLLSNQLKRWNNCILYNCNKKRHGWWHIDLPKIKVKNLDDFYATYYSLIVHFSVKYFPKLSELSSKLVKLREFIINKGESVWDAVFNRNLSDREISVLQYLRGCVIHNLYKKLRN